jgi:hypothetical protein
VLRELSGPGYELAARTDRVLTLDRRHFDVLRTAEGKLFDLIP